MYRVGWSNYAQFTINRSFSPTKWIIPQEKNCIFRGRIIMELPFHDLREHDSQKLFNMDPPSFLSTRLLCMIASLIKSFTVHVLSNLIGKCSEYFFNKGMEQSSSSKHGWPKSIRLPRHSALTGGLVAGLKAFLVLIVSRYAAFIQLPLNPMTSTQKGQLLQSQT